MEGSEQNGKPLPILPFEQVKFVSESLYEAQSNSPKAYLNLETDGLNVSQFYQSVLSIPSNSKCEEKAVSKSFVKETKQKEYKQKTNASSENSKLLLYAQEGNVERVKFCLSNGCEIDQVDNYGWTALMCAVCANQLEVVKLLIKAGADTSLKNSQGLTVLDLAKKQNVSSVLLSFFSMPRPQEENNKQFNNAATQLTKYCDQCKKTYMDSLDIHVRSIAHLFNSSKTIDKSTYYHIPETNKGFQLMLKDGWDKNKGLGPSGHGLKYPVKTVLKVDRSCIGRRKEAAARITHFGPYDASAVKRRACPTPSILRESTLTKRQR